MATNFFWSLWSFINADTSEIPFGYWVGIMFPFFSILTLSHVRMFLLNEILQEYGRSRLTNYLKQKERLSPSKRKMDCLSTD